jgi:hypothetical protein
MMILKDVVNVVGSNLLEAFPWGKSVILLVNSFTHDDHALSLASTGDDLVAAIAQVDPTQRPMLLNAKVMPSTGQEGLFRINDSVIVRVKNDYLMRNVIMVTFTSILCVIASLLTFSAAFVESASSGEDTHEGFISMLTIVLEILKSIIGQV